MQIRGETTEEYIHFHISQRREGGAVSLSHYSTARFKRRSFSSMNSHSPLVFLTRQSRLHFSRTTALLCIIYHGICAFNGRRKTR